MIVGFQVFDVLIIFWFSIAKLEGINDFVEVLDLLRCLMNEWWSGVDLVGWGWISRIRSDPISWVEWVEPPPKYEDKSIQSATLTIIVAVAFHSQLTFIALSQITSDKVGNHTEKVLKDDPKLSLWISESQKAKSDRSQSFAILLTHSYFLPAETSIVINFQYFLFNWK